MSRLSWAVVRGPISLWCCAALLVLPVMTLDGESRPENSGAAIGPNLPRLRQLIRSRMVEQGIPGFAVAVARNGKIIWEEGFGWANREKRLPASEHTLFSVASVTKPMTITGLLVLRQRGLVDLDLPANDYLRDAKLKAWVGDAQQVTLRRLANHTSGLATHARNFYEDEPYRVPSMEETILRYGNLVRVPGEQFDYSNLGYGILDYVVSRRSGQTYSDFMRQEVFVPLGMTRTSVNIGAGLEEFTAARYGRDGSPIPFSDSDHRGASAVYCSAHDLVRFGLFHLKCRLPDQKAILSDDDLDAAKAASRERIAREAGYGLGWYFSEIHGHRKILAAGGTAGASARLCLIPAKKLAVALVCNTASELPSLLENEILSVLLQDGRAPTQAPAKAKTVTEHEGKTGPPVASKLTGRWEGHIHTYQGDVPMVLWFKESGDIHVQLGNQLKTLLNHVERRGDFLGGSMAGDIGTDDASRGGPYNLYAELRRREERLTGDVITVPRAPRRERSLVSYWVELKKTNR